MVLGVLAIRHDIGADGWTWGHEQARIGPIGSVEGRDRRSAGGGKDAPHSGFSKATVPSVVSTVEQPTPQHVLIEKLRRIRGGQSGRLHAQPGVLQRLRVPVLTFKVARVIATLTRRTTHWTRSWDGADDLSPGIAATLLRAGFPDISQLLAATALAGRMRAARLDDTVGYGSLCQWRLLNRKWEIISRGVSRTVIYFGGPR